MTKKTVISEAQVKRLISRINREKQIISDSRDRLRDLIEYVTDIIGTSNEAEEFLEGAVDSLSQYL